MIRLFRSFILLFLPGIYAAQLRFEPVIELGEIPAAYEIKGDVVITNAGTKKAYLMRADAGREVKVYASKKTLLPGDTCLLTISFVPQTRGTFNESIKLVSSERDLPYIIQLRGNLQQVKKDDKMACFYFGSKRTAPVPQKEVAVIEPVPPSKRETSNKIPDRSESTPPPSPPPAPVKTVEPLIVQKETKQEQTNAFSVEEYKPNNIIFLVDISGSMKDSLKLPLMKEALHYLVSQIRDVDRITFITYADTVKVLAEASSVNNLPELKTTIDRLKARGLTKGKKAIFTGQSIAQKHFIEGGNNQIIIATDGKFRFDEDDEKLFREKQGNRPVSISTVAFGKEKEAINNLKEIAKKGDGNFIHIRSSQGSREKLFEEIKRSSRRENKR